MDFEKAYCLYRLNQVQEAYNIVAKVQNSSMKINELKAQILYRLEKYEECFTVYRDIITNSNDDYDDERETNLAAVLVHLAIENSKLDVPELREDTYELTYNSACRLVAQGASGDRNTLIEAEKKLRLAEKMCKESLEEDESTEEEIDDELRIIKVQLAYCLQLQGREKEAQVLYTNALKAKPDDIVLIAVASNNLITLNKDQNVFDSKKRMKYATNDGLEHKLTSKQRCSIAYNQCLLALYTNQGDNCHQLCKKLMQTYPELLIDATIVRAVQLNKENKINEAVNLLLDHTSELFVKLVSVQLLLSQGEKYQAIKILENLNEKDKALPGIVSALVTLYMADNNRDKASEILKQAVNYYKLNKDTSENLGTMWRQAADFHLRSGQIEIAAASLESLLELSPTDKKTLSQLVIAYSKFSPAKAQLLSKKLPPMDHLSEAIDVDALETSNWIIGTKVVKRKIEPSPGGLLTSDSTGPIIKKRNKRKRKGKLPKNYDANSLPDPERWLPKYERTGYRKKRDRRNRDSAMKGTQGTAAGASDLYDITKMPANVKPSPNPRQSPAVETSGPRQQQRKFQQKKKKKGGK